MSIIVGYAYEAALHCVGCAEKRFGQAALRDPDTKDNGGNPVHPLFLWNTADYTNGDTGDPELCDDCFEEIY